MKQFMIFKARVEEETKKLEVESSQLLYDRKTESNDEQLLVEWQYSLATMSKELHHAK